jgi:hypothetical protein
MVAVGLLRGWLTEIKLVLYGETWGVSSPVQRLAYNFLFPVMGYQLVHIIFVPSLLSTHLMVVHQGSFGAVHRERL